MKIIQVIYFDFQEDRLVENMTK